MVLCILGSGIQGCATNTCKASADVHGWPQMAPDHDILLGGTYLSQEYMLDVCFTMDSALEAWLAHALDFQQNQNQAYFHLSYLLRNRVNDSCWCYQHSFGSVLDQCFGYWLLWMTNTT